MAELNNTTQTQEPVYLNYGSNQIDQQAFLDAAANNVQQYVNNQTWSAKRKQKFLNAYSDIMSKGIIGANNSTGQWAVDLNSNIDLDSMDKKDQEMYHEAAYYILQQMKGITPREQQEEEKKSDLPVFNNDYFTEQFQGYIGNQLFGGRNWDRNTDWNVLDEADKYGIRGTNNRAEKLASMLEGYRDSLKEEDLNFEGSPFTDLNDFKTKVNNAIDQLRNGTWDQNDVDALNQIGINPETYMSTGANDMNPEGTMTRQQWKEALEKQEADKLAAEQKDAQAKALAQQQANAGVLTPINGIHAVEAINQAPAYNDYKNNFLKSQLQLNNEKPVLSQDTDILISDMTSMLGDIVSLGGGYAGAAGGITTLLSDLYGDIRRGKDTWSTIKNLGANVAWGAAGLIPGAKLGKLAKNAARIYATLQSAGILMNDEVQQSWKNLIAGKPITARDFENFKWTLHAITGGTNTVRGHFTERNVAKQIKSNTKPTIETKSGKKVTLTEDQVKDINKAGGRKGQKAAEEAFKKATGEEAKEGTFNFQENSRAWYNPNRYSQRLRNWTSDDERLTLPKTTQSINTQAVNRLLEKDKAKPIIGIGNPLNKRFWIEGGPNRGGLTWAVSPYRINQQGEQPQNNNSESSNVSKDLTPEQYRTSQVGRKQTNVKIREELPENVKFNRETISNYKNIMNNNFSTNKLQSGSSKLAGNSLQVVEQSDGTFNILFKGKVVANERNQIEIQKSIRDLIKNTVQQSKSAKSSKISAKEMGKLLKEFKSKGWLKQGGQINNFDLDKTILEFLNKQK